MIASILPPEAQSMALKKGISFVRAARKATSEENGKIVAAKKAAKKRAISAMKCLQL